MEGKDAWLPTKECGFWKGMLEESRVEGDWVGKEYWVIKFSKYQDCNDGDIFN